MRPYRNITDGELSALGAIREWDAERAKTLTLQSELLWVHNRRRKFSSLRQDDERLIRRVTILNITDFDITTNFGRYALQTGRNVHEACGCKRHCDCYGRLYLLNATPQNTPLYQEILCTTSSTSV